MSYVTHSEAGEGLLFYGNVILPFVDRFPKDTELYPRYDDKAGGSGRRVILQLFYNLAPLLGRRSEVTRPEAVPKPATKSPQK